MNKVACAILLVLSGLAFRQPGPVLAFGPGTREDGLFLGEARTHLDGELLELRARRRQSMRRSLAGAAKSGLAARSGLLVIPVDFQDQRLDPRWAADSLAARLFPLSGQSLRRYFQVASRGKFDLEITLAPVVHLAGTRLDYSDIGWNGFARTRALARQSLEAVRDLGLDFAGLDLDGPDGLPASGDDDGQVDGVLILHAGIGQENDPQEGVVQALQFFLAEPVYAGGTAASFYAVASLSSGPGIWAHETGHLLGMEDRYDLSLSPGGSSDVVARGGLGRFSLMAAGAWGSGGGWQPALPDAYSLLQLGWAEAVPVVRQETLEILPVVAGGSPARLWSPGVQGSEYFLLEARDPVRAFPFDAGLWSGELLVYHVDESLAEGQSALDFRGERYLRVGLVEADGDRSLRDGLDDGDRSDLFPGALGIARLPASGYPSTAGHRETTGIELEEIAGTSGGVSLLPVNPQVPALSFTFGLSGPRDRILLEARALGPAFTDLECELSLVGPAEWGTFADDRTSIRVHLEPGDDGAYRPAADPVWVPAGMPPPGAATHFQLVFGDSGWRMDPVVRTWIWALAPNTLDFGAEWPGLWEISWPTGEGSTTWHRWTAEDAPWAAGRPVLACTGADFPTPVLWPTVQYSNRSSTDLTSGELPQEVLAVRLVHACEFERRDLRSLMDGGLVRWLGPDGVALPARPLGGWPAEISPKSANPLQGMEVFAGDTLSFRQESLMWQVDVIPAPAEGLGPWRLEFRFGANGQYRRRGWFISEITPITDPTDLVPFQAAWTEPGTESAALGWGWPWSAAPPSEWIIQRLDADGRSWSDLLQVGAVEAAVGGQGRFSLPIGAVRSGLGSLSGAPQTVRVAAAGPAGWVHTRPVPVPQSIAGVETPDPLLFWPNPARGAVRFLVDLPAETEARLNIYDLRGRRLFTADFPGGRRLVDWQGVDQAGALLPSGTYVVRLEGSRLLSSHKVVLLR